jgi:hypothetical protein
MITMKTMKTSSSTRILEYIEILTPESFIKSSMVGVYGLEGEAISYFNHSTCAVHVIERMFEEYPAKNTNTIFVFLCFQHCYNLSEDITRGDERSLYLQ